MALVLLLMEHPGGLGLSNEVKSEQWILKWSHDKNAFSVIMDFICLDGSIPRQFICQKNGYLLHWTAEMGFWVQLVDDRVCWLVLVAELLNSQRIRKVSSEISFFIMVNAGDLKIVHFFVAAMCITWWRWKSFQNNDITVHIVPFYVTVVLRLLLYLWLAAVFFSWWPVTWGN